jgi:hypothetical protein
MEGVPAHSSRNVVYGDGDSSGDIDPIYQRH